MTLKPDFARCWEVVVESAESSKRRWPGPVIMLGGAIMAMLFPVFSALHGPTSVYEGGEWFGLEGLVWGALMNGVPSLLIAAGLMGARATVAGDGWAARVGYVLVLVSVLVPGVLDLSMRAIGAPLLMPIEAAGLLLLGLGRNDRRGPPATARRAFVGMGALLAAAFITALIPQDFSDQFAGYRVFGVLGYLLVGVGWIVVGAAVAKHTLTQHGAASTNRA